MQTRTQYWGESIEEITTWRFHALWITRAARLEYDPPVVNFQRHIRWMIIAAHHASIDVWKIHTSDRKRAIYFKTKAKTKVLNSNGMMAFHDINTPCMLASVENANGRWQFEQHSAIGERLSPEWQVDLDHGKDPHLERCAHRADEFFWRKELSIEGRQM